MATQLNCLTKSPYLDLFKMIYVLPFLSCLHLAELRFYLILSYRLSHRWQ